MQLNGLLPALAWICLAALARSGSPAQASGVVVDPAGDPIPGVRIDHTSLTETSFLTDAEGRFEFDAQGPAVVFRKSGWKSQLVRMSNVSINARVALVRTNEAAEPLPTCFKNAHCVRTGGSFCLPKLRGISIGEIPFTIDAFERAFTISSWSGRSKTMLHGTGTAWEVPSHACVRFGILSHSPKSNVMHEGF
jgi:hypothetical protein